MTPDPDLGGPEADPADPGVPVSIVDEAPVDALDDDTTSADELLADDFLDDAPDGAAPDDAALDAVAGPDGRPDALDALADDPEVDLDADLDGALDADGLDAEGLDADWLDEPAVTDPGEPLGARPSAADRARTALELARERSVSAAAALGARSRRMGRRLDARGRRVGRGLDAAAARLPRQGRAGRVFNAGRAGVRVVWPRRASRRHRLARVLALVLAVLGVAFLVAAGLRATVLAPSSVTRVTVAGSRAEPVIDTGPGALDLDGPQVRISATAASGDRPVFIGIGRSADVEAYLQQASRLELSGVADDGTPRLDVRGGEASLPDPAGVDIWAASIRADGAATLVWPDESGQWRALVAGDGASPPAEVVFTWVRAERPTWALPLTLVGLGFLVGAGVAISAIRRFSRRHGHGRRALPIAGEPAPALVRIGERLRALIPSRGAARPEGEAASPLPAAQSGAVPGSGADAATGAIPAGTRRGRRAAEAAARRSQDDAAVADPTAGEEAAAPPVTEPQRPWLTGTLPVAEPTMPWATGESPAATARPAVDLTVDPAGLPAGATTQVSLDLRRPDQPPVPQSVPGASATGQDPDGVTTEGEER